MRTTKYSLPKNSWRPFRHYSMVYRRYLAFLSPRLFEFQRSRLDKQIDECILYTTDEKINQSSIPFSIESQSARVIKHQTNDTHFAANTANPIIINQQDSNMTSYIRAVNDYTISVHELFQKNTGKIPTSSAIVAVVDAPFSEIENLSADITEFLSTIDYKQENIGDIRYHDDNESSGPDSHSVYRQHVVLYSGPNFDHIGIEVLGTIKMLSITVIGLSNDIVEKIAAFLIEKRSKYKTFVEERKEKVFYTISSSQHGFELEDLNIKCEHSKEIIADNYNDDFFAVNDVVETAIKENKRGLMLLHGVPGSGKTSYIKHLITSDSTRKIVYIPTHLASAIASPQFISFVKTQLAESVLVIEDAEQVLISRESDSSHKEAVSNILNMTDGILADALNLLIICTFNTDTKNLDSALLRKGRLLLQYEFLPLTVEKTDNLTHKLYGKKLGKSLPLSEIYNLEYDLIKPEEVKKFKMGFVGN